MTSIKRDQNQVPTKAALLNSDGSTITPLQADPATNILDTSDGSSGSDNGGSRALKDENQVPVLLAVSIADGITPVALYADSDGKLLTKSM